MGCYVGPCCSGVSCFIGRLLLFCFLSVLDIFERQKTQNTTTVWPDRGALGMLLGLLERLCGSLFGLAVVVFCIFSLVCCRFCFGSVLDTFER